MIKENNSLFCDATESFSPVADFLNLLSNLVPPERDEKHHALADLTLKQTKKQSAGGVISVPSQPFESARPLIESGSIQIRFD